MSKIGATLTVVVGGPGVEAGQRVWGFCSCATLWAFECYLKGASASLRMLSCRSSVLW